jgi:acetyl-CoA C-acetyltransferase
VTLDARTPVLAGAGLAQQQIDDPDVALEAVDLMAVACERAAPAPLLKAAQAILVPRGTWRYRDPGRLLAARFGADARTLVAEFGILQQTLVTRACSAIARGDLDVALVVGGEAKHRDLRAQIAGAPARETEQNDATPDAVLAPEGEIIARPEIDAGLTIPAAQYAVIESAWRAAHGQSPDEHARDLAAFWSGFSVVAERNVHAWRREPVSAAFLEVPSRENPMYASPYTRWHCSQWNVDQAVALVLCSPAAAERYGVSRDSWVFPVAAVESNAMIPLSARAQMHRAPAARAGAEELRALTATDVRDVDDVELYSCFPSAVRVQADEIGLTDGRALTVTGGMTFAGGPLNNANLQALATLAALLRGNPNRSALISCISGMITKQGMALWSATPPPDGFRAADVSDAARAATAVAFVTSEADGPARVDGYTVLHARDGTPERAIAVATTPAGERCVAASSDAAVVAALATDDWVGRDVHVHGRTVHV